MFDLRRILSYDGLCFYVVMFAVLLSTAGNNLFAAKPLQLTKDGVYKFAPTFTDEGRAVVFSVRDMPNRVSLKRLTLSDSKEQLLFPTMTDHQFDPAFSNDGRFLCYVRSSGSPQLILVVKNLKNDSEVVFHPQGARSTARSPRIAADNSRIVFTLSAPGGQQIASVDMSGKNLKRLTQSSGTNCWPSISPDGSKIAFSSSRDGVFRIYTMNADGSDVTRLSGGVLRAMRPAWSPDGKQIAYTGVRKGNLDIYIMQADGSRTKRLTRHRERDDYAVWHPDGKRILAVSERYGRFDLYSYDVRSARRKPSGE